MSECCNQFIMEESMDEFEMTENLKGDPGPGVAPGGTTGQILAKASDEDYDTEWIDQPELDAGHVEYDPAETYSDGTVGKELGTINSALSSLQSITEIIDTASGAIASFPDGSGLPMRSLVAEINPVQDLHGQSNPYPAGGGKNLVDYLSCIGVGGKTGTEQIYGDNTSISGNVLTITQAYASNGGILKGIGHPSLPVDTSFTVSFEAKSSDGNITFGYGKYGGGGTNQFSNKTVTPNTWASVSATFTAQGDDTGLFIQPRWNNTTLEIRNLQFEIGSSATAYAPYSNLCPISGHTGLSVEVRGKNLYPHESLGAYSWGFSQQYALSDAVNPIFLKANTAYTLSIDSGNKLYRMRFWDISGALLSEDEVPTIISGQSTGLTYYDNYKFYSYDNPNPATNICVITPKVDTWMDMVTQSTASTQNQLELGSTASTYEPYTGEAISVSFGQTVYGGSDEIVSGNGTSTMGMVDLGALTWAYNSTVKFFQAEISNVAPVGYTEIPNAICSMYATGSIYTVRDGSMIGFALNQNGMVYIRDPAFTDTATFKTAMSGQQLVYTLATPQTFTHDPQEVDTLVGQNNVFVDTGNVEVTYPADTKLYIDKKIAEALA